MAEPAKWIKISCDLFTDEKALIIKGLPNSTEILNIWVQLLCLAGKKNNQGIFVVGHRNYDASTFASVLGHEVSIVQEAIDIFLDLRMLDINEDGAYIIPHWNDYQSLDALEEAYERKKEYNRNRMREIRAKEKEESEDCDNSCTTVVPQETTPKTTETTVVGKIREQQIREDKIKEDIDIVREECNYQEIQDLFNMTCKSLPKILKLSDDRKRRFRQLQKQGIDFKSYFDRIEQSDFLTGRTGQWTANIDWILQPSHVIKIMEGNYDNKKPVNKQFSSDSSYDMDEFLRLAVGRNA